MNLNEEISNATALLVKEKLPQMVEKHVGAMVDDILKDMFSYSSSTRKQVKEAIQAKLNINLEEFDMLDYNALVSKAIGNKLAHLVQTEAIEPVMKLVQNTVGYMDKKQWKLSEIFSKLKDTVIESSYEDSGDFTFKMKFNEKHSWVEVFFDAEADKEDNECDVRFIVNTDSHKRIFIFNCRSHWSAMGEISPSKLTQLGDAESFIYRLYAAQIEVEVDDFDAETEWQKYTD